MAGLDDEIRDAVRRRYAEAATSADCGCGSGNCCTSVDPRDSGGREVFGAALFDQAGVAGPGTGVLSLGCGVPTLAAGLRPGETVLDLGSGAGRDAITSALRVGADGLVIGVDMTDEMLGLARRNAADAGVGNVRFLKGLIEELPLPDASIDVVISNCVVNLAADKGAVLAEVARVLRPGGRVAISDVIADPDMDDAGRADMQSWTGCIAGALTRAAYEAALGDAGFTAVEITETHRVHDHAGAATIRARLPGPSECCASSCCGET